MNLSTGKIPPMTSVIFSVSETSMEMVKILSPPDPLPPLSLSIYKILLLIRCLNKLLSDRLLLACWLANVDKAKIDDFQIWQLQTEFQRLLEKVLYINESTPDAKAFIQTKEWRMNAMFNQTISRDNMQESSTRSDQSHLPLQERHTEAHFAYRSCPYGIRSVSGTASLNKKKALSSLRVLCVPENLPDDAISYYKGDYDSSTYPELKEMMNIDSTAYGLKMEF
ncbi:hypothetical protein FSARC_8430 [Fusarium sarcochroum]|uniref:Uncharacterized protein n=1 Tax=Fusarium sarcochroum TaxID=1208366 RepID=A0A8H4X6Y6_9HYPO|nr:hypothetical protein FSARC_8430 [Fusarium sarcochroum]